MPEVCSSYQRVWFCTDCRDWVNETRFYVPLDTNQETFLFLANLLA